MESLIRGKLKKDSNMQPLRKGFRTSLSSGSVEAKVTFGSATFHRTTPQHETPGSPTCPQNQWLYMATGAVMSSCILVWLIGMSLAVEIRFTGRTFIRVQLHARARRRLRQTGRWLQTGPTLVPEQGCLPLPQVAVSFLRVPLLEWL